MNEVTLTYTSKESDKMKCLSCMDKISTKLDNLRISFFMTSDRNNILCKTYGDVSFNIINSGNNSTNNGATICPDCLGNNHCPHSICTHPKAKCHFSNARQLGNILDTIEDNSDDKFMSCLFRITPTDIYNGIFLHVIKLHGETCDLKMTFKYDEAAATELVNVIKFLVE